MDGGAEFASNLRWLTRMEQRSATGGRSADSCFVFSIEFCAQVGPMDNATLMYIVIGLLFIFFVVLLVFSAKSWRVLHLITAFLVFIAAGFLMYFTAATLRTHQELATPTTR